MKQKDIIAYIGIIAVIVMAAVMILKVLGVI
jgi:hypothetical protein